MRIVKDHVTVEHPKTGVIGNEPHIERFAGIDIQRIDMNRAACQRLAVVSQYRKHVTMQVH